MDAREDGEDAKKNGRGEQMLFLQFVMAHILSYFHTHSSKLEVSISTHRVVNKYTLDCQESTVISYHTSA